MKRCAKSRGFLFFFNDTATTEIYTLSLHDALPISMTEKTLGAEHPELAKRLNNLALLLHEQGNFDEAKIGRAHV